MHTDSGAEVCFGTLAIGNVALMVVCGAEVCAGTRWCGAEVCVWGHWPLATLHLWWCVGQWHTQHGRLCAGTRRAWTGHALVQVAHAANAGSTQMLTQELGVAMISFNAPTLAPNSN